MTKEKLILTDADGVLLNWEYAFNCWMEEHGYTPVPGLETEYDVSTKYGLDKKEGKRLIRFFNESAAIGFLPALRDAEHYVRLLGNLGYKFHCITSLSKDPNAQRLRTKNLEKLFGDVFEKFIYLDTGEDKDEVLKVYKDSGLLWVEDKPENADVGARFGLNPVLMEHGHNMDYSGPAKVVVDWKSIYDLVTAE